MPCRPDEFAGTRAYVDSDQRGRLRSATRAVLEHVFGRRFQFEFTQCRRWASAGYVARPCPKPYALHYARGLASHLLEFLEQAGEHPLDCEQWADLLLAAMPGDYASTPATEPTDHLPATASKVDVLAARVAARQDLHHPKDAQFDEDRYLRFALLVTSNGERLRPVHAVTETPQGYHVGAGMRTLRAMRVGIELPLAPACTVVDGWLDDYKAIVEGPTGEGVLPRFAEYAGRNQTERGSDRHYHRNAAYSRRRQREAEAEARGEGLFPPPLHPPEWWQPILDARLAAVLGEPAGATGTAHDQPAEAPSGPSCAL